MDGEINALFNCDALALLEPLPPEVVTLAYLDPPWNTDPKSKELPSEQYAYYLAKVVQQVRRLLNNEGSLFVHWSQASPLDVRLVMNQAFGEQPKYEITWHLKRLRRSPLIGPRFDSEFILVYSKSEGPIYNPVFRALSSDDASAYSPSRQPRTF